MGSVFADTEVSSRTFLPWPRAPQTSAQLESQTHSESSLSPLHSSTTATVSSSVVTSSTPLFQDPSIPVTAPSAGSNQNQAVSKVVLEYILIVAFAMIFGGLLIQRIIYRRQNSASPWRRSSPDADAPALPRRFPRTTGLTQVPPYPYSRRTRALDTDAAGRRVLDTVNTSDHDGYIGDKDVLPAYDNFGGPPQYREVALELNVMPTTRNASENSTGNVGDSNPPPRDTDDSHSLPDSGQGTANVVRDLELTVPPAVHLRHQTAC